MTRLRTANGRREAGGWRRPRVHDGTWVRDARGPRQRRFRVTAVALVEVPRLFDGTLPTARTAAVRVRHVCRQAAPVSPGPGEFIEDQADGFVPARTAPATAVVAPAVARAAPRCADAMGAECPDPGFPECLHGFALVEVCARRPVRHIEERLLGRLLVASRVPAGNGGRRRARSLHHPASVLDPCGRSPLTDQ